MADANYRLLPLKVCHRIVLIHFSITDNDSLHATPMFLIASYVPAFRKVNPYFTPSQW